MIRRFSLDVFQPAEDVGIRAHYPIDHSRWVAHPESSKYEHALYTFELAFANEAPLEDVLHLSADQRYEFYLDGELVSCGPDRCDLLHWSFASFELFLEPGEHTFMFEVLWLAGETSPCAQICETPGFILAAEKNPGLFNTAQGKWNVRKMPFGKLYSSVSNGYQDIGPGFGITAKMLLDELQPVTPVEAERQFWDNPCGVFSGIYAFYPSPLPEQKREYFNGGRIRAITNELDENHVFTAQEETSTMPLDFTGGKEITIDANTEVAILWDLDNYYCGYAQLSTREGDGAEIGVEWAESLFRPDPTKPKYKDNRDEVAGKVFYGFGDHFFPDGRACNFKSYWWRAGRYVMLKIKTAAQPLTIENVLIRTTRYPLEMASSFGSSDRELGEFIPLALRVLQMCSHETLMDCPYYEQMMYVGDSRLEMLVWYAISADTDFAKRCIELFDFSRNRTGFIAERYPSDPYQLSLSFSIIYIYMLHDFMMWRGDLPWLRQRLRGIRCLLENFRGILNDNGLLEGMPGWTFVDWVPGWKCGMPEGASDGVSPVINLMFSWALKKAADMERVVGEESMAVRNIELAAKIDQTIFRHYWVESENLFADNTAKTKYSEHTQCIALLGDCLPVEKREACFDALISRPQMDRTTIYFSFYLLDTFRKFGRGDLLLKHLDSFKELVKLGFKTTREAPEPSRSDCHAWGSHPLYHCHASLLGLRPLSPGMERVEIVPSPGTLEFIKAQTIHPNGCVEADLKFSGATCSGTLILPAGVSGIFCWNGTETELSAGENSIG